MQINFVNYDLSILRRKRRCIILNKKKLNMSESSSIIKVEGIDMYTRNNFPYLYISRCIFPCGSIFFKKMSFRKKKYFKLLIIRN